MWELQSQPTASVDGTGTENRACISPSRHQLRLLHRSSHLASSNGRVSGGARPCLEVLRCKSPPLSSLSCLSLFSPLHQKPISAPPPSSPSKQMHTRFVDHMRIHADRHPQLYVQSIASSHTYMDMDRGGRVVVGSGHHPGLADRLHPQPFDMALGKLPILRCHLAPIRASCCHITAFLLLTDSRMPPGRENRPKGRQILAPTAA